MAQVVNLCLGAGAKKVRVFDCSCNNPRRSYLNSQIEPKAKAAGAEVQQVRDHRFRKVLIPNGEMVKEWPIYTDYLELQAYG